jgi:hypothetical protein
LRTFDLLNAGSTEVPGLSGGNVNRNLSLVNALHDEVFARLVAMEGLTLEQMMTEYHRLTGLTMDENEGTL